MTGWTLQVIEPDGTAVATLNTLPGGSITMAVPDGSASPHRVAGLQIAGDLPDMRGRLLRDTWDGHTHIWLPARPAPRRLDETDGVRTLSGVDLTGLLRAQLPREEILAPGRDVADWVDHLLTRYAAPWRDLFRIHGVNTSVRSEQAFAAGSQLLAATVGPLTAAAMTAWQPLPNGTVETHPWTPAAQRGPVATFGVAPDESPFLAGWDDDPDDMGQQPNEVLAIIRAQGDLPQIVGRWADEADIARVGQITEVVPGTVEATDQTAADMIAARHAEEHVRPRRTLSFTGAFHPILPGQVARVRWPRWGIDGVFEVTSKTVERNVAADTTYTLREV